jgi:release factor glutamine methyltransferase
MKLRKIIKKIISPFLIFTVKIYLKKERTFSYKGIKLKVMPGVFHPGLFFSTKILLKYLSRYNLSGKRVLELGAGSGLISIYAAKSGASVTASDISKAAIECIKINSNNNNVLLDAIQSDLFERLSDRIFDLIIINPPYFPSSPKNESDYAWFCGEDFEYFRKLFCQLDRFKNTHVEIIMILSEDCAISKIREIAYGNKLDIILLSTVKNWFEDNCIYSILVQNQ